MVETPRPVIESLRPESRLVRATAAELRAEALRGKLSLGLTYCALAETAIQSDGVDLALGLIQRARDIGVQAQRHLKEAHHVSERAAGELRDTLKVLESEVLSLAVRIKQPKAP